MNASSANYRSSSLSLVKSDEDWYSLPDWSKRIPALDGLRGIAILMVLMRHSVFGMETNSRFLLPILQAGQLTWSGVDLFFVLSGFLIGGILLDAKNSRSYFKTFYIRRAFRIFPLYYLIIGLFLFRHLPFHLFAGSIANHSPLSIPWFAYFTLTQNLWMPHLGWFGPPAMTVTWSLAVEEQFYLTIPFLIRYCNRRRLALLLSGVVIASAVLRVVLQHFPHGAFSSYVLMPCRADALCIGVLAAIFVRNPNGWRLLLSRRKWLRIVTLTMLAGVIYMTWMRYDPFTPPMNTYGYTWLALFYGCCLLLAISARKGVMKKALSDRRLIWLGTLAYCAYLIHWPFIIAGRQFFESGLKISGTTGWFLGGMLGVAATLLTAALSWKFFEKPLLKIGHRQTY